jgi:hypothetical protein
MHPLTIQLLNESRGIFNNSNKANLAPNTLVQGTDLKKPKKLQNGGSENQR